MPKITFLILNYNSISELKACEESIRKNCSDYHIVVVDNGSSKNEIDELNAFCAGKAEITLLVNNENLGFARGNNVGFRYIRNNIECDYIAMINSDTLILDESFTDKIETAYEKYKFAVMGPDVLPSHSNPMINEPDSKEKVKKCIKKTEKQIAIMKVPVINIMYLCFNKVKVKLLSKKASLISEPILNCELHGCFLIFSNLYTLDGLCDETFLYGEEDLLAKSCRDNDLTLLYYPDLKIVHNESKSTKRSTPDLIERKLFFLKNRLDSYYVLLGKYE
jgi:GT2 family glycosyltransferase